MPARRPHRPPSHRGGGVTRPNGMTATMAARRRRLGDAGHTDVVAARAPEEYRRRLVVFVRLFTSSRSVGVKAVGALPEKEGIEFHQCRDC